MRSSIPRLLGIALSLSLLVSCASSRRMTRVSPMGSGGCSEGDSSKVGNAAGSRAIGAFAEDDRALSEARVNVWPFYYRNDALVSVLWPCYDYDDRGVAIRPFFNKEDHEYAILFPLVAWNPETAEGWCLTGYWGDDFRGCFPLFHSGEKLTFIGPFWWTTDDYYGLFPALCFSRRLNFVGPIYAEFHEGCGGLFPIIHADDESGWFFPIYSYDSNPIVWRQKSLFGALAYFESMKGRRDSTQWICPLWFSRIRDEEGKAKQTSASPLFWYSADGRERDLLTPVGGYGWRADTGDANMVNVAGPVFTWLDAPDREKIACVFPLSYYSRSKGKKDDVLWILPYLSIENEKKSTIAVFPLFSHRLIAEGERTVDVAGPLFYEDATDSGRLLWAPFPLFGYDSRKEKADAGPTKFYSWPLAAINNADVPAVVNVHPAGFSFLWRLGFFYRDEPEDACDYYYVRDLQGTRQISKAVRETHFLLFNHLGEEEKTVDFPQADLAYELNESLDLWLYGEKVKESDAVFCLYNRWKDTWKVWDEKDVSVVSVRAIEKLVHEIGDATWAITGTADSAEKKKALAERKKRLARLAGLLEKQGYKPASEDLAAVDAALKAFAARHTTRVEFESEFAPFFFRRYASGDTSRWWAFLRTIQCRESPGQSRFDVFWYAYRHRRDGDVSRTDMFPFVSWNASPKASEFSFAWRLFHFRRTAEGTSGHIFFIPW